MCRSTENAVNIQSSKSEYPTMNRKRGFTLIELLVVIVGYSDLED